MMSNYTINFILKYFLKRIRVANFADIKIVTIFIKRTFRGSKKSLKNETICINMQPMSVFLDKEKIEGF